MNKYWIYVLLASTFEICWVAGLKHADSWFSWGLTITAIVITFFLLPAAAKHLPIGTVYAVFAGLGTAGTVIVEMVVYDVPFNPVKVLLIMTLLIGVIGLKLVSNDNQESAGEA